jgi:hypothetical protein
MCLACEMDELWLLYLEQQAQAAKKAAADTGSAATFSAPAQGKSDPASAFVCEEPTSE